MKPTLTVVGLGSGAAEQLTLGVWRRLQQASRRYVRTAQHPMMTLFAEEGWSYSSFDELYEQYASFPEVYAAIADALLAAVRELEEEQPASSVSVPSPPPSSSSVSSSVSSAPTQLLSPPVPGSPTSALASPAPTPTPIPVPAASPTSAPATPSPAAASAGSEAPSPAAQSLATPTVVYAVPGHPMVAEQTVQLLRERCRVEGITLEIIGGESFLDQAFVRLGFDPIEGFQLLDASTMTAAQVQPGLHTLIAQVYDAYTASDAKLTLMERYPDDYPVVVGHALGVPGKEQIQTVPLYELDRLEGYGNLSLIWVPRADDDALRNRTFERLHEIVAILRSPEGCPWDREQTHQSIRKNFIEETYEALEALDNDDPDGMREEFGDVLLQIMLHSQMEEELGTFSAYDVIQTLNEKLIFRHPHVFGDVVAQTSAQALSSWEDMKAEEKRRKGQASQAAQGTPAQGTPVQGTPSEGAAPASSAFSSPASPTPSSPPPSVLDGLPPGLPELMKAYKLQKKAAKVGFDWEDLPPVLDKIAEELAELREAIRQQDAEQEANELGDLLFAVVNAARFIDADPEEALSRTNRKFRQRFSYIEEQLRINGKSFDQTDLTEMDAWWEEAKRR